MTTQKTAPLRKSSTAGRRTRAAESFKTASDCIGILEPKMALFAITRGQFSMLDAILAVLDQTGPAKISFWTWTIAEYEIECLTRLQSDARITDGLMVIDHRARKHNRASIDAWTAQYGARSVRYTINHAKIATVENDKWRCLLRGSMNLNFNPRFEQFDLTEGGPDFDLVKQVEDELPFISDQDGPEKIYAGAKLRDVYTPETLSIFDGIKTWAK